MMFGLTSMPRSMPLLILVLTIKICVTNGKLGYIYQHDDDATSVAATSS